jgi:hypothetical protein
MYSFDPEPERAELDALVAALERLLDDDAGGQPAPYRSEWRRAALEEGVSPPEAGESDR